MKLTTTSRKMMIAIGIAAGVFVAGGFVFCLALPSRTLTEALFFAVGVALMALLNAGKILLLERTVKKALELDDPNYGKNYVRFQYLIRYFLTAAVLLGAGLIGYLTPHVSIIIGAIAGVFTMQISVIIVRHMKQTDE